MKGPLQTNNGSTKHIPTHPEPAERHEPHQLPAPPHLPPLWQAQAR